MLGEVAEFLNPDNLNDYCAPPGIYGEWSYPVGGFMHRLNLIKFYRLGSALSQLSRLSVDDAPLETWKITSNPFSWLLDFLHEAHDVPCVNAKTAARKLAQELLEIRGRTVEGPVEEIGTKPTVDNWTVKRVKDLLAEFEKEFEHDSRELNIFSVPNRCAYSTTILIETGERLLPESIRSAVTDYARNELHEAGKCLAFGASTAAGFHLLRGVESVLRSYFDALSGGAPRPTTGSGNPAPMREFINRVRSWADPKVISVLEQITSLHRNPLNHPDDVLGDEEAIVITGIVVSAISGMVLDAQSKGHWLPQEDAAEDEVTP
jgi:hypothetical protein